MLARTYHAYSFDGHGFPGTSLQGLWAGAPPEEWTEVLTRRFALDPEGGAEVVSVEHAEYSMAWMLTVRASPGDHAKIRAGLTREGLIPSRANLEVRWVEFGEGEFAPAFARSASIPSDATLVQAWRGGRGKVLGAFGSIVLWDTPGKQDFTIRDQRLSLEFTPTSRRDGWVDLSLLLLGEGEGLLPMSFATRLSLRSGHPAVAVAERAGAGGGIRVLFVTVTRTDFDEKPVVEPDAPEGNGDDTLILRRHDLSSVPAFLSEPAEDPFGSSQAPVEKRKREDPFRNSFRPEEPPSIPSPFATNLQEMFEARLPLELSKNAWVEGLGTKEHPALLLRATKSQHRWLQIALARSNTIPTRIRVELTGMTFDDREIQRLEKERGGALTMEDWTEIRKEGWGRAFSVWQSNLLSGHNTRYEKEDGTFLRFTPSLNYDGSIGVSLLVNWPLPRELGDGTRNALDVRTTLVTPDGAPLVLAEWMDAVRGERHVLILTPTVVDEHGDPLRPVLEAPDNGLETRFYQTGRQHSFIDRMYGEETFTRRDELFDFRSFTSFSILDDLGGAFVEDHAGLEFPEGSSVQYHYALAMLVMRSTEENHRKLAEWLSPTSPWHVLRLEAQLRVLAFDDRLIDRVERARDAPLDGPALLGLWKAGEGETVAFLRGTGHMGVEATLRAEIIPKPPVSEDWEPLASLQELQYTMMSSIDRPVYYNTRIFHEWTGSEYGQFLTGPQYAPHREGKPVILGHILNPETRKRLFLVLTGNAFP